MFDALISQMSGFSSRVRNSRLQRPNTAGVTPFITISALRVGTLCCTRRLAFIDTFFRMRAYQADVECLNVGYFFAVTAVPSRCRRQAGRRSRLPATHARVHGQH